ncbi:MAG: SdrD B-like domain-containing protein, partial [Saprospiraceae bacterium]
QAKAIGILTECCPESVTLDQSVCGAQVGDRLSLSELLACEGIVCEGQWSATPGSTGLTFNDCDLTVTVDGLPACGSFELTNSGVSGAVCAPYTITLNVSYLAEVTAPTIAGDQALCPTEDPAAFTISTTASSVPAGESISYQWQSSTTSASMGFSNIAGATMETYDAGPISGTTYYRVVATVSGCSNGMCSDTSNVVTLSLNAPMDCCPDNDQIICDDGSTTITLTADAGLTNIEWFNSSDSPVGSGNTLTVDASVEPFATDLADGSESYYYTAQDGAGCSGELCCPVRVITQACAIYSLGSTVFEDLDNNGLQDGGEPGIAGVRVELFDDQGNEVEVGIDGILGTSDDGPGGILTTGAGDYFFQNLPPGNYVVQIPASNFASGEVLDVIAISSTPTDLADNEEDGDDNGDQPAGAGTVVSSPLISLGEADGEPTSESGQGGTQDDGDDESGDMTVDFGFFAPVSLGDTTWVDLDRDGLQDMGEPSLEGVTVSVYNADGSPVTVSATGEAYTNVTTSNANGFYEFTNLSPGDYYVTFDLSTVPSNAFYQFTTNTGGIEVDDSDADPTTGQTDNTGSIPSGGHVPDLDAGVVCIVEAEAGIGQTICSTAILDLTTLGASITPSGVAGFGATWTSNGTGIFDDGVGRFGVATTYTPSAMDVQAGQIILTLSTDSPAGFGSACSISTDDVLIVILKVDCGSFPWDGN